MEFVTHRLSYLRCMSNRKLSVEWRACSRWPTGLRNVLRRDESEWRALLRPFLQRHFAASLCKRNSNLPNPRGVLLNPQRNYSKEFGKTETARKQRNDTTGAIPHAPL